MDSLCGYAQPIDGAAKKVKELVGEVLSSADVDKLERWVQEENVQEDVKVAVAEMTAISKQRLRCASMLSETLEKVLPK